MPHGGAHRLPPQQMVEKNDECRGENDEYPQLLVWQDLRARHTVACRTGEPTICNRVPGPLKEPLAPSFLDTVLHSEFRLCLNA